MLSHNVHLSHALFARDVKVLYSMLTVQSYRM